MKKLRTVIAIVFTIYIFIVSLTTIYIKKNSDGIVTSTIHIKVTNQGKSIIKNLYVSSGQHPKFKAFSDLKSLESESMEVAIPVIGEDSAYLTYTDELGEDHLAPVIGYLMGYDEVDVTILSADKDGLILEVENK